MDSKELQAHATRVRETLRSQALCVQLRLLEAFVHAHGHACSLCLHIVFRAHTQAAVQVRTGQHVSLSYTVRHLMPGTISIFIYLYIHIYMPTVLSPSSCLCTRHLHVCEHACTARTNTCACTGPQHGVAPARCLAVSCQAGAECLSFLPGVRHLTRRELRELLHELLLGEFRQPLVVPLGLAAARLGVVALVLRSCVLSMLR